MRKILSVIFISLFSMIVSTILLSSIAKSSQEDLSDNGTHVIKDDKTKEVVWNFDVQEDFDMWSFKNQMNDAKIINSNFEFTPSGSDPYMTTEQKLFLNAKDYTTLEFKIKNGTSSEKAEFYWISTNSLIMGGSTRTLLNISSKDSEYKTYKIDLSKLSMWKDFIYQIRFDPVANGMVGGSVSIDYIRLYNENNQYEEKITVSGLGLDITDKSDLVAINYAIVHDVAIKINNGAIYDNTEILTADYKNPQFGPVRSSHYWGKSQLGYYSSTDKEVVKTHLRQLADANVDFICLDNSNVLSPWISAKYKDGKNIYMCNFVTPATVLLDTMLEMRQNGEKTPYVMFFTGSWASGSQGRGINVSEFATLDTYYRFYYSGKYDDLFVYYEGKPFILLTEVVTDRLEQLFTVRKMWADLKPIDDNGTWLFLQPTDKPLPYIHKGKAEQLPIYAAVNINWMSYTNAIPRENGKTYFKSWAQAFEYRPKIALISFWNIWNAYREENYEGKPQFTDVFDREFSWDIEPMDGGFGDLYLKWTKEYIKAYKANEKIPEFALESFNGVTAGYPYFTRVGFRVPPNENPRSFTALQHSLFMLNSNKTAFKGNGFLNVMFDTMEAKRYGDNKVSVLYEIDNTKLSKKSYVKASVNIDKAPNSDDSTKYLITMRIYGKNNITLLENSISVVPEKWEDVYCKIVNEINIEGVEIILTATGKGTEYWSGNMGIDNISVGKTTIAEKSDVILCDFEDDEIGESKIFVVLGSSLLVILCIGIGFIIFNKRRKNK